MSRTPLFILAIENSNPSGADIAQSGVAEQVVGPSVAVGVIDGDSEAAHSSVAPRLLAAEPIRPMSRETDDVIPAIARVAKRAGVTPSQFGLISVSIGPGGYTAVRVSTAAAKMIAEAAGARCVGVPTPLVIAAHVLGTPSAGEAFAVVLAGKDDSAHCTRFEAFGEVAGLPGASREIGLIRAADLASLNVRTLHADRFLPFPLRAAAGELGIRVIEPTFSAEACLSLAGCMPSIDAVELLPIYPREPDAVTLWRQRVVR